MIIIIPCSGQLINQIKSGIFDNRVKIEILTKDETLIKEITPQVMDGNISVDKDRDIRRSLTLELMNIDNEFTPSPTSLIWLDKKLKVSIGMKLPNGDIEYIPQGVFCLSKPIANTGVGVVPSVRIEGLDKMFKWGKLINNLTLSAGLNVAVAIQLILNGVETKFNFDECSETIPYELNYQSGTDRKQIVKEIVDMITWDIGYNVYGELRLKPHGEPENGVVTWEYKAEDYTLYAGSEKELDMDEFANVVLTVGASSQSATVSAIAKDDDVLSNFSTVNIGEYLYIHNNGTPDPLITTEALAMSRSQYEIRNRLKLVEKQKFKLGVANFLHEEGDVIKIIDNGHNTDDKYELLRFNISLTQPNMDGEAWRVKRLL